MHPEPQKSLDDPTVLEPIREEYREMAETQEAKFQKTISQPQDSLRESIILEPIREELRETSDAQETKLEKSNGQSRPSVDELIALEPIREEFQESFEMQMSNLEILDPRPQPSLRDAITLLPFRKGLQEHCVGSFYRILKFDLVLVKCMNVKIVERIFDKDAFISIIAQGASLATKIETFMVKLDALNLQYEVLWHFSPVNIPIDIISASKDLSKEITALRYAMITQYKFISAFLRIPLYIESSRHCDLAKPTAIRAVSSTFDMWKCTRWLLRSKIRMWCCTIKSSMLVEQHKALQYPIEEITSPRQAESDYQSAFISY